MKYHHLKWYNKGVRYVKSEEISHLLENKLNTGF